MIADLYLQIDDIKEKILKIQDECSHPKGAVTYQHFSNTGNYDPTVDCYWTDFSCALCAKRWTLDGSVGTDFGEINRDKP